MNFEWNILKILKFFIIISKFWLISSSNVDNVVTDTNNIELSTDSDSSNEEYNNNKIQ